VNFIPFSLFVILILVVGILDKKKTTYEVLENGLYWLSIFKDAYHFCKSCEKCQRTSNITHKNQMPLMNILVGEIFYV
jgi:hypothetical protein